MFNLPNILTVVRIILVPVFAVLVFQRSWGTYLAALIVFCVAAYTDRLDGKLARKYGAVTNFGKIADPFADKALMLTAFVILSLVQGLFWWFTIGVAVREIAVTLLRFVLLRQGKVLPASMGGKLKTSLQMLLVVMMMTAVLIEGHNKVLDMALSWLALGVLLVAFTVTIITGLLYFTDAYSENRKAKQAGDEVVAGVGAGAGAGAVGAGVLSGAVGVGAGAAAGPGGVVAGPGDELGRGRAAVTGMPGADVKGGGGAGADWRDRGIMATDDAGPYGDAPRPAAQAGPQPGIDAAVGAAWAAGRPAPQAPEGAALPAAPGASPSPAHPLPETPATTPAPPAQPRPVPTPGAPSPEAHAPSPAPHVPRRQTPEPKRSQEHPPVHDHTPDPRIQPTGPAQPQPAGVAAGQQEYTVEQLQARLRVLEAKLNEAAQAGREVQAGSAGTAAPQQPQQQRPMSPAPAVPAAPTPQQAGAPGSSPREDSGPMRPDPQVWDQRTGQFEQTPVPVWQQHQRPAAGKLASRNSEAAKAAETIRPPARDLPPVAQRMQRPAPSAPTAPASSTAAAPSPSPSAQRVTQTTIPAQPAAATSGQARQPQAPSSGRPQAQPAAPQRAETTQVSDLEQRLRRQEAELRRREEEIAQRERHLALRAQQLRRPLAPTQGSDSRGDEGGVRQASVATSSPASATSTTGMIPPQRSPRPTGQIPAQRGGAEAKQHQPGRRGGERPADRSGAPAQTKPTPSASPTASSSSDRRQDAPSYGHTSAQRPARQQQAGSRDMVPVVHPERMPEVLPQHYQPGYGPGMAMPGQVSPYGQAVPMGPGVPPYGGAPQQACDPYGRPVAGYQPYLDQRDPQAAQAAQGAQQGYYGFQGYQGYQQPGAYQSQQPPIDVPGQAGVPQPGQPGMPGQSGQSGQYGQSTPQEGPAQPRYDQPGYPQQGVADAAGSQALPYREPGNAAAPAWQAGPNTANAPYAQALPQEGQPGQPGQHAQPLQQGYPTSGQRLGQAAQAPSYPDHFPDEVDQAGQGQHYASRAQGKKRKWWSR